MFRTVLALGVLAGCAAPPAIVQAPAPPPSTAASVTVSLAALAPVRQPDLPAPLRPAEDAPHASGAHETGDHEMGGHAAMGHAEPRHAPPVVQDASSSPLAASLDAYLAIHAALADDATTGVPEAARALASAFERAIQDAPADDPHVWHMRAGETSAVQAAAVELAAASDLETARAAFGRLSVPFASLVEAVGAPEGYDLVRQTCGMQPDAPEGGVWLQRAGEVRNPYVGAAMRMCARDRAPLSKPPATEPDAAGHNGHTGGR